MTALHPLIDAISWFFSNDDVSRIIALFVWCALSVLLAPSLWRCIVKRPRYIDPLLTAALILILNRIAFGVQAYVRNDTLADLCRWTSIAGGSFYLFVVWDYLRPQDG